jgi:hypothetical protein
MSRCFKTTALKFVTLIAVMAPGFVDAQQPLNFPLFEGQRRVPETLATDIGDPNGNVDLAFDIATINARLPQRVMTIKNLGTKKSKPFKIECRGTLQAYVDAISNPDPNRPLSRFENPRFLYDFPAIRAGSHSTLDLGADFKPLAIYDCSIYDYPEDSNRNNNTYHWEKPTQTKFEIKVVPSVTPTTPIKK